MTITMHERLNSLSANVQINDAEETLTIFGVKLSAELLRSFDQPTPRGKWFRIIKVEDGMVTLEQRSLAFPDRTYTYTYVTMEVSPVAYNEIATKLRQADYHHAINNEGVIDMHGLGLVCEGL